MDILELRRQRRRLGEQAREILNGARGRSQTAEERQKLDDLFQRAEDVRRQIDAAELEADLRQPTGRRAAPGDEPEAFAGHETEGHEARAAESDLSWRSADGTEVRALRSTERFAAPGYRGPGLGAFVLGAATGDWRRYGLDDQEHRAMSVGTPGAGGHLVPDELGRFTLDLVRARSRVVEAGALSIPMQSSTLKVAKLIEDPTGHWRAENDAITPSAPAFAPVEFRARTLAALVYMSMELAQDAPNAEGLVESSLAAALGSELDRVALLGDGEDEEPQGLSGVEGVQEIEDTGSPTWQALSRGVELLQTANHAPGPIILHPRDAGTLDRLTDQEGRPLSATPSVAALRLLTTSKIPIDGGDADNESEIYMGAWSSLLIGMRSQIVIDVSREAADAFPKMQVAIRAYLRADVQIARPDAFVILRGVLPEAEPNGNGD